MSASSGATGTGNCSALRAKITVAAYPTTATHRSRSSHFMLSAGGAASSAEGRSIRATHAAIRAARPGVCLWASSAVIPPSSRSRLSSQRPALRRFAAGSKKGAPAVAGAPFAKMGTAYFLSGLCSLWQALQSTAAL